MVTPVAFATRMPSKLAFSTVRPEITTPLIPEFGAAEVPSTKMPLDNPSALIVTRSRPSPRSEIGMVMVTDSLYMPAWMRMTSPGADMERACLMVWRHPLPLPLTQRVAEKDGVATKARTDANVVREAQND